MSRPRSIFPFHVFRMTGSPYWWMRWYEDAPGGKRILRRLSTAHTFAGPLPIALYTRENAQEIVNRVAGVDDTASQRSRKFLALWALEYITERIEYEGKRRRTVSWYRDALAKFGECFGSDFSIAELKTADVWTFQKFMIDSGCGPATVNSYCRAIRAVISRLVRQGMMGRNPLAGFERIRESHGKRHLSLEEVRCLLTVLDAQPDDPYCRLVRILLFTGIRRGEVLGIERADVDLVTSRFLIGNIKSHDGRKRWLTIPPAVKDDFAYFLSITEDSRRYQFPFRVCHPDTLSHQAKRFLIAAGLPGFHTHSLRHTFATLALEHGASIRELQRHLDHSSVTVTEIYAHDSAGKGVFDIGI